MKESSIFIPLLAILFITLKLTGVIAWSWWWVLAPLWAGFAFFLACALIPAIVALTIALIARRK